MAAFPDGEGLRSTIRVARGVVGADLFGGWLAIAQGMVAAVECALGLRLLFGASPLERRMAIALLLTFGGLLAFKGLVLGWDVPCGCLEGILVMSTLGGLLRNMVLVALLGVASVWSRQVSAGMFRTPIGTSLETIPISCGGRRPISQTEEHIAFPNPAQQADPN